PSITVPLTINRIYRRCLAGISRSRRQSLLIDPIYYAPLMLPIDRPQKIICIGLNYRDHAEEQGVALPERPLLFAKWPNTLIGPGEPIRLPAVSHEVDYEAELGVVIGRRASQVSPDDALGFVEGYVVANDVSGRDLQFSDGQWVRGK